MKIKIELTNNYGYDLAAYPYNDGAVPSNDLAQTIAKLEGKGELIVERAVRNFKSARNGELVGAVFVSSGCLNTTINFVNSQMNLINANKWY